MAGASGGSLAAAVTLGGGFGFMGAGEYLANITETLPANNQHF